MGHDPLKESELKKVAEALLFITDQPLSIARMASIIGEKDVARVSAAVDSIRQDYADHSSAVQVLEIAEGWQMATRPEHAGYVRQLYSEKMTMRLSTAALETLSIIAYKQPLTRAEIEEIRGVEVIAALETLLEKGLVRVVGRKETVGRPLLYGTTPEFLRQFGLRSVADLPPLDAFQPPPAPVTAPPAQAPAGAAGETAAVVENAPPDNPQA